MAVALVIAIRLAARRLVASPTRCASPERWAGINAIDFTFDLTTPLQLLVGPRSADCSSRSRTSAPISRRCSATCPASSVTQSRLGLLFNGMVKVPMQFFILFVGAMVFVFYQFTEPPIFFNRVQTEAMENGPNAEAWRALEERHGAAFVEKREESRGC